MTYTAPQKIYKYQPFNLYGIINLIRRELYFSKPENFNDPYDCDPPFEITKAHRSLKNIKSFYDKTRNYEMGKSSGNGVAFDARYLTKGKPNKRFERDFINNPNPIREQIRDKVGVTCFSESVDNFLLWSHYADKHQGFCLEFDTCILLNDYPGTELYKVNYPKSNKRIRFSILDILNDPNLLEKILTRKSYLWRYENEWRLFCQTGGNTTVGYDPKAITGVYFGYKMPKEYKHVIISTLANPSKQITIPDISSDARNYKDSPIVGTQTIPYDMKTTGNIFKVERSRFIP